MVLVLIPVTVVLITVVAALDTIIWMWGNAHLTHHQAACQARAVGLQNPGFYVPKWRVPTLHPVNSWSICEEKCRTLRQAFVKLMPG